MASWDEIQAHVRQSYKLQRDEPRAFQMAFSVEAAPREPAAGKPAPNKPAAGKTAPPDAVKAPPARPGAPPRSGGGEANVQTVHGQLLAGPGLERPLLVLRAEICGERALSPVTALQAGAKLALGGLIVSGGRYQLRCALPSESLQLADLDFALRYLVREAAELRQRTMQRVSLRGEDRPLGMPSDLEGIAQAMQLNVLATERSPAAKESAPPPPLPLKKPEDK